MKKKPMSLAILFAGALVLSASAAFAQGLVPGQDASTQARPEAGMGTTFVDGLPRWYFQFTDEGDGDFFETLFDGDPSDFIAQKPDGSYFMHLNEGQASMCAIVSGLVYCSISPQLGGDQGGMFQSSFSSVCAEFDPQGPSAWCAWGEGLISVNARAEGVRLIDGAACTMSVHLTAQYVNDPNNPACQYGGIWGCLEFPGNRVQDAIEVDCN